MKLASVDVFSSFCSLSPLFEYLSGVPLLKRNVRLPLPALSLKVSVARGVRSIGLGNQWEESVSFLGSAKIYLYPGRRSLECIHRFPFFSLRVAPHLSLLSSTILLIPLIPLIESNPNYQLGMFFLGSRRASYSTATLSLYWLSLPNSRYLEMAAWSIG